MIIIPARLASSRFTQKVLVDVGGLPMVIRTAKQVQKLDRVVVAADDEAIMSICRQYDIEAILTSTQHKSGTDRINECAEILNLADDESIINVQADEPFIEEKVITALQKRVLELQENKESFIMASCYSPITKEAAIDPNLVKVILNTNNNAIYFSRSPIPYDRSGDASYFGHIGIYGFDRKSLKEFCSLKDASLEDTEKLEQLRAIYNQKNISMVGIETRSFGIDTKEDLEKALKMFL